MTDLDYGKQKLIMTENAFFGTIVRNTYRNENIVIKNNCNDTIDASTLNEPQLVFYFTPGDCRSCIEQNIIDILNLAKATKCENLLILTGWEQNDYIKSISDIFPDYQHCFGTVITAPLAFENCFFMLWPGGNMSNVFFLKDVDYNLKNNFLNYMMAQLKCKSIL